MTPQDLFDETAAAFNGRDYVTAAQHLATPIVIAVGVQSVVVKSRAAMVQIYETYRENLDVESFQRTECKVTYTSDCVNGKIQALARWANYNDQEAELSSYDANYILEDAGQGRLHCTTVEIMEPVKARFLAGFPLE